MSPKTKGLLYLLVIISAVSLTEAFNSDRRKNHNEENRDDSHHLQIPDDPVDKSLSESPKISPPDRSALPKQKSNTRVRRARQRHDRASRDPQTDLEMDQIFSPQMDFFSPNLAPEQAAFNTYSGYNSEGYNYPQPIVNPFMQPPQTVQNTYVPHGHQVNNYYYPTSNAASVPLNRMPNGFPAPFFNGQVLIIPVPFCGVNTPGNNNATGGITGFPSRDSFDINVEDYYSTLTGINLGVVKPFRPPSVTQPPLQHIDPNEVMPPAPPLLQSRPPASGASQGRPRPSRPNRPIAQRPNTTQRPFQRPSQSQNVQQVTNADRCVWAIIKCCSLTANQGDCFSRLGCPGNFYENPCNTELGKNLSEAAAGLQENGLIFS